MVIKKLIAILLILFMSTCCFAIETTLPNDVLQGSVSVQIKPYYDNWSSNEAFNKINRIGTKLVLANGIEEDIVFVVTDKDEVNASTNIHDRISIYSGLLKYVETEDELAFVIGHEMGHVTKNHVKKSLARRVVTGITGATGTVLSVLGLIKDSSSLTKAGAILAGTTVVGGVANKKFSRNQEIKADRESIDYMVKAGYNPLATISILNKISGNYFDFFSSHPSGEKRIKKAYEYIEDEYPQYIEQGYGTTSYERALKIINED